MTTQEAYELGIRACRAGESASPYLNSEIRAAIGGAPVGDPHTSDLFRMFSAGYEEEREALLQEALEEEAIRCDG